MCSVFTFSIYFLSKTLRVFQNERWIVDYEYFVQNVKIPEDSSNLSRPHQQKEKIYKVKSNSK